MPLRALLESGQEVPQTGTRRRPRSPTARWRRAGARRLPCRAVQAGASRSRPCRSQRPAARGGVRIHPVDRSVRGGQLPRQFARPVADEGLFDTPGLGQVEDPPRPRPPPLKGRRDRKNGSGRSSRPGRRGPWARPRNGPRRGGPARAARGTKSVAPRTKAMRSKKRRRTANTPANNASETDHGAVASHDYTLLLLNQCYGTDPVMKRIAGCSIAKHGLSTIRKTVRLESIVLVVATALGTARDVAEAERHGYDEFLRGSLQSWMTNVSESLFLVGGELTTIHTGRNRS